MCHIAKMSDSPFNKYTALNYLALKGMTTVNRLGIFLLSFQTIFFINNANIMLMLICYHFIVKEQLNVESHPQENEVS